MLTALRYRYVFVVESPQRGQSIYWRRWPIHGHSLRLFLHGCYGGCYEWLFHVFPMPRRWLKPKIDLWTRPSQKTWRKIALCPRGRVHSWTTPASLLPVLPSLWKNLRFGKAIPRCANVLKILCSECSVSRNYMISINGWYMDDFECTFFSDVSLIQWGRDRLLGVTSKFAENSENSTGVIRSEYIFHYDVVHVQKSFHYKKQWTKSLSK